MKKLLFIVIACLTAITSCKKDNSSSDELTEMLTPEQAEFLENKETQAASLEEMKLPNGESVKTFLEEHDPAFLSTYGYRGYKLTSIKGIQTKKNILIGKMLVRANYLISHNLDFLNDGQEPKQTKIAYGLGAKDYSQRLKPSKSQCDDKLFALDCSGFLAEVMKAAGINIRTGAARNQTAEHIQSKIRAIAGYEKIEVRDEGQLNYSDFESGDVIYFSKSGDIKHIGLVLQTFPGKLMLFQSNGSGEKPACENNIADNKGPRMIELDNPMKWKDKSGNSIFDAYGIIRIVTNISGKWQFHVRCPGQSNDVFMLNLDFPTNQDKQFTQVASGIDYTGVPLTTTFNFTYNKTQNILSCTYTTVFQDGSPSRTDKFSLKLEKDDTGYFITEKVIDNSGCNVEVRLVNMEE